MTGEGGRPEIGLAPVERDGILFHGVFAAVCALVLLLPSGMPVGRRLLGLVLAYNVALPLVAWCRGHRLWLDVWLFLAPLSALQIFPDWFLAAELDAILFPGTGAPMVGPIPLFMAGMWVIPLFLIVGVGVRVEHRRGMVAAQAAVALLSGVLFVGSEATLWRVPVWWAQGVTTVGRVAVYLIVPEVLLGLSAFWAYRWGRDRATWQRLGAAFVVMLLYTGGLSFFYLLVEGILRR